MDDDEGDAQLITGGNLAGLKDQLRMLHQEPEDEPQDDAQLVVKVRVLISV